MIYLHVYDTETELYYLQSRYYNPEVGRFINADGYASTGQGFIGNNMFAYCGNNPVVHYDPSGRFFLTLGMETHGYSSNALMQYIGCGGGSYGGGITVTEDDLTPDYTESVSVIATAAVGDSTASKSVSLSSDSSGNHAVQASTAFGVTSGVEAGVGFSYTCTNAKTVFDLEGESINFGLSIGWEWVLSVDIVKFSPKSDPDSTKWGITIGISAGAALEVHDSIAYTTTVVAWDRD